MVGQARTELDFLRVSRNLSNYISPSGSSTIYSPISQSFACTENLNNQNLIVYFVTSKPNNYQNREAIRNTWGMGRIPRPIFFTGITKNDDDMVYMIINVFQNLSFYKIYFQGSTIKGS